MDLGNLFQVGLAALSLGSMLGLGLLRGVVVNLRERITDYEKEVTEKERRLTVAERTLAAKSADLEALARVVTGEVHWVKIGAQLDHHHDQAVAHWVEDERLLRQILKAVTVTP